MKYWARNGHRVTVIAGMVNSKTGKKPEEYQGKLFVREQPDENVTVIRTHVSQLYNKNFLGRLWAYFSFLFFSSLAMMFVKKPDFVLTTSPPLNVGLTGVMCSKLKRIPFVFEIRDLWPESAIDTGVLKNKFLIRVSYWMEKTAYKHAKYINVLTPAFREKLIEKGINSDKIWFVPNGADLDIFQPGENDNWVKEKYSLGDKFVVTYLGAHGVANHLVTLIEAAKKLMDRQDIVFMLIGDGMQKEMLKEKAKEYGLSNVIFVDNQPKDKVVDFCNAMDVGTAVLQKNDTFKTVYPNKVFDYMSCAKPVLLNIDGVARELVVGQAKAGVYAKSGDVDDFVKKVLYLYENRKEAREMGQRGYEFVKEHFSRESLAAAYEENFRLLAR